VVEYNRTMLHHKTMVVDGLWCTVGTTNFDNRSFSHNEENNVCGCDAALADVLTQTFERDLAACDVVTLDAWRKRGVPERTLEALASFVQDQV
jgi:cardiolipin synthase